jgi:oligoribonuclease
MRTAAYKCGDGIVYMAQSKRLFWADLEFTGLNPEQDVILEIASAVTDSDLNVLAEGPVLAIRHPEEALAAMDDWNRKHHGESGLLDRVRASPETHESAGEKTLEFLKANCRQAESPLCGNSVHVDRWFMRRRMPRLEAYLHYRNIDVSTIKELAHRWYPDLGEYEKKKTHRARDDILESIGELRHYKEAIFRL